MFDEIIDRTGTYSIKYDPKRYGKPENALPLWVADMDFKAPPCVTEALAAHVSHGIFGYSDTGEDYFEAIAAWQSASFGWTPEYEWLVKTPGIVTALHIAVRAFTEPGDAILIQRPVYGPFATAATLTNRRIAINELLNDDGYYHIDFDAFEQTLLREKVRLFLLCNPHNPVGRAWTREELSRLGEICARHGVLVIADEIHEDFVYAARTLRRHEVFAAISEEFADFSITCTAPSKTFNLAGLQVSNIFIKNKTLRDAFRSEYAASGLSQSPLMGLVACKAAYEGGADWLAALKDYLESNLSALQTWADTQPGVLYRKPEGTYLAWLDLRELGFSGDELERRLLDAGVWLSPGTSFGADARFMRLNIACPRRTLDEALLRMSHALKTL